MEQGERSKISFVFLISSIYALGITVYFLLSFFSPIDFSIPKGEIPLIGEASKNNISVGNRVGFFYRVIFIGTLLWLSLTWLFHRIYKAYFSSLKSYSTGLYFMIPLLTFTYMFLLGSEVTQVINLLLGIFVIDLARKIIISGNSIEQNGTFISVSFESTLGLAFLFYILLYFFLGNFEWIQESTVTLLLSLLILFQFISFVTRGVVKDRHLQLLLLSFSGIPILAFIAVEFHILSLEKDLFLVGSKTSFTILMLIWVIVSWILVRRSFWSLKQIQTKLFATSIIFGFSLLAFYQPIITANEELFELANPANSLLRIMKFGEVPILDFMSSHMFYEQWYGIIYQSIFGFKASIDFTIYSFLNLFIYLLIIYWILIRVGFTTSAALITIFFFPILHQVFFAPVIYVFLILFSIQKLTTKATAKQFFLTFLLLFLLVVWRIDTGVIAIFTTALFLPIYWWLSKQRFPILKLLKGIGFFVLFLIILGIIAISLRPLNELWSNFLSTLHYVKGSQAHGYSQLFDGTYHQFYLFHVLFVVIAVTLSVLTILKIRTRVRFTGNIRVNMWLIFALFSFLIFITNAQRGLVRHGFAEGSDLFYTSTFYLGLAFFIVDYYRNKMRAQQFSIFFFVLFFAFVGTKYFPFFPEKLNTTHLLNSQSFSHIDSLLSKKQFEGRVKNHDEFKKQVFGDFKTYLNTHLSPEASFIDFSNTPMLYYYCERNVPGYFNQNLQNTIDDYLQFQLINAYNKKKLPITVYSSYPPNWYDQTDGILNTVRYYWVAEYIFENYKPLGVLNNRSIWGEKSSSFEKIEKKDTLINQPVILDLGYIAGWQGNYFEQRHLSNQSYITLKEKELKAFDHSNLQTVSIDKELIQNNHVELILKLHPEANYYLNEIQSNIIVRDTSGNVKHRVTFKRDDKQFTYYAIRLSNHYFWHQNESLIIEFPEIVGIEKVILIKDNRNEH